MAAEIEEVLVSLHIVELQDVAPHRGQIAFEVIDGNLEPQGEMRGRDQRGRSVGARAVVAAARTIGVGAEAFEPRLQRHC